MYNTQTHKIRVKEKTNMGTIVLIIFIILIILLLVSCIRIVPQSYVYIIEFLGKYKTTWDAGIHFKIPILERVARKISLKEQVMDFPPQSVITKDNVTIQIDSVVFSKVFEPKLFTYGIENPLTGLQNLSATTLRNIIGDMELDQTLTSRDQINSQLEAILDEATDAWGLKVTRVEIKNIDPPREIEEVMTKQMRAERERRQTVLEAQAHKESVVARAQGDKEAKVLAAEAERDAQIALAEGRAKAIRITYEAEAAGLEKLNGAAPSEKILKLKGIEALKDMAEGQATKIYMPTDIMNSVASLGIVGESLGIGDKTPIKPYQKPAEKPMVDPCLNKESSKGTVNAAVTGHKIDQDVQKQYKGETRL